MERNFNKIVFGMAAILTLEVAFLAKTLEATQDIAKRKLGTQGKLQGLLRFSFNRKPGRGTSGLIPHFFLFRWR